MLRFLTPASAAEPMPRYTQITSPEGAGFAVLTEAENPVSHGDHERFIHDLAIGQQTRKFLSGSERLPHTKLRQSYRLLTASAVGLQLPATVRPLISGTEKFIQNDLASELGDYPQSQAALAQWRPSHITLLFQPANDEESQSPIPSDTRFTGVRAILPVTGSVEIAAHNQANQSVETFAAEAGELLMIRAELPDEILAPTPHELVEKSARGYCALLLQQYRSRYTT